MKRWTPKLAVSRSTRRINAAIVKLQEVGYDWEDIDPSLVGAADDAVRELEMLRDQIVETVRERLAAGEHVGI